MKQHPLFTKFRRQYLAEVTGYTRGYLSRISTGRIPLSRAFVERVSLRLNQPGEELFLPNDPPGNPVAIEQGGLGQWLEERCHREHLSLRQAGARTGLAAPTIGKILKGSCPSAVTIKKLAMSFGGDGNQGLALEDRLLVLAGYRTERPQEELSELLAQLMDKAKHLNDAQLKMMVTFAEFLAEIDRKGEPGGRFG